MPVQKNVIIAWGAVVEANFYALRWSGFTSSRTFSALQDEFMQPPSDSHARYKDAGVTSSDLG